MTTYTTGTVSVGANATSVTGTGTAWLTSGIRAGDLLLLAGNVIPVAAITSNTALTLARPWPGAAQSGANYDILLIDDDVRSLVASNLLLQQLTAGTLTSLAALASGANTLPYFTGQNVMGLTGLTPQARTLLSSTLLSRSGNNLVTDVNARFTGGAVTQSETDATSGRLTKVGDFGLGAATPPLLTDLDAMPLPAGFYRWNAGGAGTPPTGFESSFFAVVEVARGGTTNGAYRVIFDRTSERMWMRRWNGSAWSAWITFRTSANTTVDSNGFLKAASPILRLFGDGSVEEPVQPTGAEVTRLGEGSYEIANTLGLSQSGWQIEVPRDFNGNNLCFVDINWSGGVLTVQVSEPVWDNGRWIAGEPIDVPDGRWIDIRLHEVESPVDPDDGAV